MATAGNAPAFSASTPDAIQSLGDEAVTAYLACLPLHQQFIVEYLTNGYNGRKAYKAVYGHEMGDTVADANASRLLGHDKVDAVLQGLRKASVADFQRVQRVYVEAMEATKPTFFKDEDGQPSVGPEFPDHDIRIKAAAGYSKLKGLNAADKIEVEDKTGVLDFYRQKLLEKRGKT